MADYLISSDTTAVATVSDAAVTLVAGVGPGRGYRYIAVINEGAVAGFFSIDGGTRWARLPASGSVFLSNIQTAGEVVKIKREPGGSNLSGVYGFAY